MGRRTAPGRAVGRGRRAGSGTGERGRSGLAIAGAGTDRLRANAGASWGPSVGRRPIGGDNPQLRGRTCVRAAVVGSRGAGNGAGGAEPGDDLQGRRSEAAGSAAGAIAAGWRRYEGRTFSLRQLRHQVDVGLFDEPLRPPWAFALFGAVGVLGRPAALWAHRR
jgi:hypothetical protein